MDCGRDVLLANGGALGISIFFVFTATGVGCSAMGGVAVFPVSKIGFTVGAGIGADHGIPKQYQPGWTSGEVGKVALVAQRDVEVVWSWDIVGEGGLWNPW